MKDRKEIENMSFPSAQVELLLDIRDLLIKLEDYAFRDNGE